MISTSQLTALVRENVDVETSNFTFQAVSKEEFGAYNHDERKKISQLQQVVAYYEDQKDGYGYQVALLLEALDYALAWLVDYEMEDISEHLMQALVRHRDYLIEQNATSSRARARTKAFEWLVEELEELSGESLWTYAEGA